MSKTGKFIIKISILSVVLSLTALLFCAAFFYVDGLKQKDASSNAITKTVVIDPGHGGEDGGAVSKDGVSEKNLNLSVALKLSEMLKSCGINTVMTRNEDIMLYDPEKKNSRKMQDLKTRLDIAESYPDAVFVSIHMNKFAESKYSGLQVFYSANDSQSQNLAEKIKTTVKEFIQPENERETKQAGTNIFLLDQIECPAVLVECGFLSNEEECTMLQDNDYQASLAAAICKSVIEFLNEV